MDFMIGAQEDTSRRIINDSIVFMERIILPDTTLTEFDSAYLVSIRDIDDTNGIDTIKPKKTVTGLKSKVKYGSMDSLRFDINKQMVYIYGNAEIYYEDISLKSAYIDIDFQSNLVFATGLKDTTGKERGLPVFSEKSMEFQSRTMKYNYETKKGLILDVVTQDGEGNIYGSIIKKMPNDEVNIKKGSYTTCPPCENKDYEFRYYKSKVIPGKRIVTGPAYLVIEDVPTPLFIPFGIFPNRSGQRSGIVIPTWGESAKRGFYFENGGYYWAINDYMDLKLVGDIYTPGSGAAKPSMR